MYVICRNDYPIATAETEQKANEARAYIQRIYDMVNTATSFQKSYIHVHEVPTIGSLASMHRLFLVSGGNHYQYILNNLMYRVEYPLTDALPILNQEEAVELFKNFRKTYPAIDDFIKRYNHYEAYQPAPEAELKPRSPGLDTQEAERMKVANFVKNYASDLNHYDSDDLTPPESVANILNDPNVRVWLDDMLKHCVDIALGKLEELKEES